jgi:hypothetical protein
MEVPITRFRKELFSLADRALEGGDVWFTHKGCRLKVVPEGKPLSKLSRVQPMEIVASGVDLEDQSWKQDILQEWEQGWDNQLRSSPGPSRDSSAAKRANKSKVRRRQ